jgi:hypothetical protein
MSNITSFVRHQDGRPGSRCLRSDSLRFDSARGGRGGRGWRCSSSISRQGGRGDLRVCFAGWLRGDRGSVSSLLGRCLFGQVYMRFLMGSRAMSRKRTWSSSREGLWTFLSKHGMWDACLPPCKCIHVCLYVWSAEVCARRPAWWERSLVLHLVTIRSGHDMTKPYAVLCSYFKDGDSKKPTQHMSASGPSHHQHRHPPPLQQQQQHSLTHSLINDRSNIASSTCLLLTTKPPLSA